uniref:Large ribosomal subunit protein uL23 n=1 Tax=uncultured Nitrospirae bacterium Rifle_16ft_4_minimus_39958 TaxID=1665131 RepID=A0A0H4TB67_9BACT|nr:50S ribosomal protein L23, large subunit ribosomal protein L23 [uncultured Nitrospirae bacterium Rifle_16ft_4_minimus_39958]
MNIDIHDIISYPIITERSTELREGMNKVLFIVNPNANKIQIKRAVEELLKVKVEKVNLINMPEKKKKLGKFEGIKSGKKKAVVTLKQGEKLAIFEGA